MSHSTPEAEIVAAAAALRIVGLPALDLWDRIFLDSVGSKVNLKFYEDSTATIAIIKSGRNPQLRHVSRTHDVSIKWLSEAFRKERQIVLEYVSTDKQCADIFTKAFDDTAKWEHALSLIGFRGPRKRVLEGSDSGVVGERGEHLVLKGAAAVLPRGVMHGPHLEGVQQALDFLCVFFAAHV